VRCCVHPHSHHGSLLETEEQYDYLFGRLPPQVGWCPDAGHIVRGGQELLPCLNRHAQRIVYFHLKDPDAANRWQPLGRGRIDFKALASWLRQRMFDGWLVAEEESELALRSPEEAIRHNRDFLNTLCGQDA
jgi:sugar phosphate isomerase/epimerase